MKIQPREITLQTPRAWQISSPGSTLPPALALYFHPVWPLLIFKLTKSVKLILKANVLSQRKT